MGRKRRKEIRTFASQMTMRLRPLVEEMEGLPRVAEFRAQDSLTMELVRCYRSQLSCSGWHSTSIDKLQRQVGAEYTGRYGSGSTTPTIGITRELYPGK